MLAVAGEVFAEHGFHAASMDEIAERADISKPMLYAYFDSKEGLYAAYMQRTGDDLLAAIGSCHLRGEPLHGPVQGHVLRVGGERGV